MYCWESKVKTYIRAYPLRDQHELQLQLHQLEAASILVCGNMQGNEPAVFMRQLIEYETETAYRGEKNKNWYLYRVECLLPQGFPAERRAELARRIMVGTKHTDGLLLDQRLPYVCYIEKHGKGEYLVCVIGLRIKYKRMREKAERYASDGYRNGKGAICKADAPGAVLAYRKGDIKRIRETEYSKKTRIFTADRFAQKGDGKQTRQGALNRLHLWIRQIYVYHLSKLKVKFEKYIYLPKKRYETWWPKYQMMNVLYLNEKIGMMERQLQYLYDAMLDTKAIQDREAKAEYYRLYQRYRTILKQGFFNVALFSGKKKIKLSLHPVCNWIAFRENCDRLKEEFDTAWESACYEILGSI